MNSRMDKYDSEPITMSRTEKNANMYGSINVSDLSKIKTNTNVSVISDATKQIDIEKIKKYIYSNNDEVEERKRIILDKPEEKEIEVRNYEQKDYDINSVLERARENKETTYEEEKYRKFNNTEYDILKKLKLEEKKPVRDDDITGPIDELNTEEKTIVDLIKGINKKSSNTPKEELFGDLMGSDENTKVMPVINEESNINELEEKLDYLTRELSELKNMADSTSEKKESKKHKIETEEAPTIEKLDITSDKDEKMPSVDKTFFTNSLSFKKGDFETLEDDNDEEDEEHGFFSKVTIVFIILSLVATAVIVLNYVLELNWF